MKARKGRASDYAETEVFGKDSLLDMPHDPNATDVLGDEYRRDLESDVPARRKGRGDRD